ncbi:hypothetical protein BDY21DRAFT_360465 [Lineolata rhizophorae]|uniref:Uncharacterized protein n=1 Tax=Lineolata rhizophorae TaxID=578093 RepID=A0A6A6PBP3_9PEZI|nr:hypothetical protein BDY21DRAFT_360465 [Lineolata rhizophorae]
MQPLVTAVESTLAASEEVVGDADEPPDEQTPRPSTSQPRLPSTDRFDKAAPAPQACKSSLLTQAIHTSESDAHEEEEPQVFRLPIRGMSTCSAWSNGSAASTAELTSDGGLTSPGTRTSTPSPPLPPASFRGLAPGFQKPEPEVRVAIHNEEHDVVPVPPTSHPAVPPSTRGETAVEAGLGRKRCITFACGKKEATKLASGSSASPEPSAAVTATKPAEPKEPSKRPCSLKFVCPTRNSSSNNSNPKESIAKPRSNGRLVSPPPPPRRLYVSPKVQNVRAHRDSDATVRNESPKGTRKTALLFRPRKYSDNYAELNKREATRFHEFASSEEEVDEWVQESTCHRMRLTVNDTLHIENKLRQLGEEAEEEAMEDEAIEEEEEAEEDEEDEDRDALDEEDVEEDEQASVEDDSDDGFHSDDEHGFASSDESDNDSDCNWWAPGRSTAATSTDHLDLIRNVPRGRSSASPSPVGSMSSACVSLKTHGVAKRRKSQPMQIRPITPDLPDSTDFVCGTLDEDRPLEEAYLSCLEQRRAAKHKVTPQDIDPTFPTSDPEMDEEDDEDDVPEAEESDHMFMMGQPDGDEENECPAAKPFKRSPRLSPKRMRSPPPPAKRCRSPPPAKRCRSPPPRRLFGLHSPKRMRSPPPAGRIRSPPPTRRTSFQRSPRVSNAAETYNPYVMQLGERPAAARGVASSLPRQRHMFPMGMMVVVVPEEGSNEDQSAQDQQQPAARSARGAIDIVKGLEKKRQLRREKLFQKHCWKVGNKDKERRVPPMPPGKGCERMREMGLGLAATHKGGKRPPGPLGPFEAVGEDAGERAQQHILSL